MIEKSTLKDKWNNLEAKTKKIWVYGLIAICMLFVWQFYSNYEYHRTQSLKSQRFIKSNSNSNDMTLNSQSISNPMNQDVLSSSNFLPQTNRNMGLEDLKADFDNTRQIVINANEEIKLISDQNKILQNKISILEQAQQQLNSPTFKTLPFPSLPSNRYSDVDLKTPLPPLGDFKNENKDNHTNNLIEKYKDVNSQAEESETNSHRSESLIPERKIKQWSNTPQKEAEKIKPKSFVTIPATSVIEAVMLSGINARTSATGGTTGGSIISANNVGSPFISRIKGSAILPNGWRAADLTDCFLSGTGIGILSTERANVTADKLTCINTEGVIFETKIKAYGVDLDGIQGLSGRLVTKQGSILAKEAAAGMFAGVGSAFSPQSLPSYNSNTTSGSQQGYVTPNPSLVAGSAVGQGVSTSLGQLSKFYLDYARQMFPIVEVNAGTRVSWVVQESFDLITVPSKEKSIALYE